MDGLTNERSGEGITDVVVVDSVMGGTRKAALYRRERRGRGLTNGLGTDTWALEEITKGMEAVIYGRSDGRGLPMPPWSLYRPSPFIYIFHSLVCVSGEGGLAVSSCRIVFGHFPLSGRFKFSPSLISPPELSLFFFFFPFNVRVHFPSALKVFFFPYLSSPEQFHYSSRPFPTIQVLQVFILACSFWLFFPSLLFYRYCNFHAVPILRVL